MKIFVTGATGFVGGAAARRFVAAGHTVRAMSRRPASDEALRALGIEPVRCTLEDVAAAHVGDAEVVLHCAAFVEDWGPKDAWYRGNVLGTERMLKAAQDAGARRFIHIGTEAALVHGQDLDGVDEAYPLAPDSPYPYCATKAQAEQRVRAANRPGFETLVLRPRFIWGPGDTTLLPVIREMAASGKWKWIDHGRARTSTTHIDNLVHAIERALTAGAPGAAYFVLDAGETTMRAMIDGMAASVDLTLPAASVPGWLASATAWTFEKLWRLFNVKRSPPLTRHAAMVLARTCVLDGSKAAAELGYVPVIDRAAGLSALRDSAAAGR